MTSTASTIADVDWWSYVQRIAVGETNVAIGRRIGITGPSVGRWKTGLPDPQQAAAFARAYNRPVLEAFIAAGFLTGDEAGQQPTADNDLGEFSKLDLIDEVRRRLIQEETDAGNTDEKMSHADSEAQLSAADLERMGHRAKVRRPTGMIHDRS